MSDGRKHDQAAGAAVRAALARVLASDAFSNAPQLSAFLTLIVDYALDGRGPELKGYTIAVEALGRPPDFDPQVDPIVRVEAGRLRKALALYYTAEGSDDPVRIAIPVGAYVPVFEATGKRPKRLEADAAPPAGYRRSRLIVAGIAALAAVAVVAVWASSGIWYRPHTAETGTLAGPPEQTAAGQALDPGAPSEPLQLPIVLVAVSEPSADPARVELAQRFSGLLVDAMARFDDLITVTTPNWQRGADTADYVFELSTVRTGNITQGLGRLRNVRDGRVVWAVSSNRDLSETAADPELDVIARRLATWLAGPYGLIQADVKSATRSPALRCLVQAFDVGSTGSPQEHLAARDCIERILQQEPSFHPAWSRLTRLILDEYTSGLNPQAGPPLDRALAAALTVLRLAPSSARGQQVLMDTLFARGEIENALRAGQRAMLNNPYDPDIMADVGARFVRLNRPAEGLPLLQSAIAVSRNQPPWYAFFAFLAAEITGAKTQAEGYAAIFATDETPLSLVGRAMTSVDGAALADALARLDAAAPLFGVDRRQFFSQKGFAPEVIEHIVAELEPQKSNTLR